MNDTELFIALLVNKMAECLFKLKQHDRENYYNKYEEMDIKNLTVHETLLIINDALSFGFEFIVKDGKILFTEQTF